MNPLFARSAIVPRRSRVSRSLGRGSRSRAAGTWGCRARNPGTRTSHVSERRGGVSLGLVRRFRCHVACGTRPEGFRLFVCLLTYFPVHHRQVCQRGQRLVFYARESTQRHPPYGLCRVAAGKDNASHWTLSWVQDGPGSLFSRGRSRGWLKEDRRNAEQRLSLGFPCLAREPPARRGVRGAAAGVEARSRLIP